jgi:hypothetical protein
MPTCAHCGSLRNLSNIESAPQRRFVSRLASYRESNRARSSLQLTGRPNQIQFELFSSCSDHCAGLARARSGRTRHTRRPEGLVDSLSFALRFDDAKRRRGAAQMLAAIVAMWLFSSCSAQASSSWKGPRSRLARLWARGGRFGSSI